MDDVRVGGWLPEGVSGIWSVRRTIVPENAYQAPGLLVPGIYTGLYRQLPNGTDQRVMFDEPAEIAEAQRAYDLANGNVLVTGLGIGMVAAWLASKINVERVDVVENSPDVIALVAPYLPSPKIHVIYADAFSYIPTRTYNFAWHDCWYTVPERVAELMGRYHIPVQSSWQG